MPTTQELYEARLKTRQKAQKFDPAEIRLSEVGHCLRRASLRILGYEANAPSLRQESIFLVGDQQEEHIADLWEAAYPGEIDRQVLVSSPFGVGHMDVWVKPLRHYVECKSTTLKSVPYLPHEEYIDQVTLYHHYYIQPTGGGTAELAYRVKETGEILSIPVAYDPERAKRLVARLEELQDAVSFGQPLPIPKGYSLDQFPCGFRDAAGTWTPCPFWQHCWSADANDSDDPKVQALVLRHRDLSLAYREAEDQALAVKDELDDVRSALSAQMSRLGKTVLSAEGYEVRRIFRRGWSYYDAKAAIQAGAVSEEALRPFQKTREGSVQWAERDLSQMKTKGA